MAGALALAWPSLALADATAQPPVEGPADEPTEGPAESPVEDPAPMGDPPAPPPGAGIVEFGLGAVMGVTAVGLAAYASVELGRANARRDLCATRVSDGLGPCTLDPPGLGYAAVGLGYGLGAALALGAGFAIARGVRARRTHRAPAPVVLVPWTPSFVGSERGGGVSLSLRF